MKSLGVTAISVCGASPGADLGGAWLRLHSRKAPENASEKGIGGSARSCRPLLSSSRVMATVEFVDGARSACSRIGLSWATVRGDVAQPYGNKIKESFNAEVPPILCNRETRASYTSRRNRHRAWTTWSARVNAAHWQACNSKLISRHPQQAKSDRRCAQC